jgi:hypothetical protein
MSYAYPSTTREKDRSHTDSHDDERHPALTPLVIDVIPDQTRAELEESIDEPLTVERGPASWESASESGGDA